MKNEKDVATLRDLAARVKALASSDAMGHRREYWRAHNSFERVRPPVVIRGGYEHELVEPFLTCEDEFYRRFEYVFRATVLHDSLGDDFVFEPWATLRATVAVPDGGIWGVASTIKHADSDALAYHVYGALASFDEIGRMAVPVHMVDEKQTALDYEKLADAIGDYLTIHIDRGPEWKRWNADISTQLGFLRGHEQMLYDMSDSPEGLHRLLSFMRDGILKAQAEAEAAGDWTLAEHENQSVPYSRELRDPAPGAKSVKRDALWGFFSAQEFASVSPEQHYEFLLQYQLPIMENFGLIAYGCCEDLTRKIGMLRKVKNLRRISVTPFADAKKCAEQIGTDYICAYRPHPNLVANGFDRELIGGVLKRDMAEFSKNKCYVDICLKDISTVGNDPNRLILFTRLAKEIAEDYKV